MRLFADATRMLGRLGARRARPIPPSPFKPRLAAPSPEGNRAIVAACRNLSDGAQCGPEVLALVQAEMQRRRRASGTDFGPDSPAFTALAVRRAGTPDWWNEHNVLLAAADAFVPTIEGAWDASSAKDNVVVLGSRSNFGKFVPAGNGILLVLGDQASLPGGVIVSGVDGTILIGEATIGTFENEIVSQSSGTIIVGAEGLWAYDAHLMTADGHAIRDTRTGKRINSRSGRIVIDRHVWLGYEARIRGETYIGPDCIIGEGSIVKGLALPANSVAIGRPARQVRRNVTWTIEDPPE